MTDLLTAYRHASSNRAEIDGSAVCGCFYCMQTFAATEVTAWTGFDLSDIDDPVAMRAATALCPACGSESVIGDQSGFTINHHFLALMHEAWFERTIISKPGAKK